MLAAAKKRLRLAERNASARQAARQIAYVAPGADVTVPSGSWQDVCHAVIVVSVPCRVRINAQVRFVNSAAGGTVVSAGIFGASSGLGPIVGGQSSTIEGTGDTATTPILQQPQSYSFDVDVQPGQHTYFLCVTKSAAAGTIVAAKSLTLSAVTFDASWLQVAAL
jgi:hypothetical protein